MSDYCYSSDDEVHCGPLTKREIIKTLKGKGPKIERRYTDHVALTNSATSIYLTANDETQSSNEEFLQKLTNVINDEEKDAGTDSYVSKAENLSSYAADVSDNVIVISDSDESVNNDYVDEEIRVKEELEDSNLNESNNFEMEEIGSSHLIEETSERLASFTIHDEDPVNSTVEESEVSSVFNDTLEEMERALREGLDYKMPGDREIETVRPAQKPIQYSTSIPVLKKCMKGNKYDYITSPIADYIKQKSPTCDTFKVPSHIPKIKSTPNPKPKFNNIVSPIGIYIKNSPSPCLIQNVPAKTSGSCPQNSIRSNLFPSNGSISSETSSLPVRVYKPGKKVEEVVRTVNLPKNIAKLVPEVMFSAHLSKEQENLMDLTSLDEGNLTQFANDCSNVSFIQSNQVFKK